MRRTTLLAGRSHVVAVWQIGAVGERSNGLRVVIHLTLNGQLTNYCIFVTQ